jgi:hypothetical protein
VKLGKNSDGPEPDLPVIAYGANRQIGVQNLGDPILTDPVSMLLRPQLFDQVLSLSTRNRHCRRTIRANHDRDW